METLTLTTPVTTAATTTTGYKVVLVHLDLEGAEIAIHVRGTNGERRERRYEGADATAKMVALNKANLTIKSLQRRILELLTADGTLAGVVTGTPD
jgi:hypothetical protein